MSHGKNLAREIAQTRKKIAEGIEAFDEMYDTLRKSANSTTKDKLEADLKTQIKKLQRMRDDVKKWAGSSDVKDKGPLLEDRKTIEQRMESFKALEKEIKTKAFSKEGLIAATRLDPAEQAKAEARNTLELYVDSLNRQIEQTEAEIELIQAATSGSSKKKSKSGAGSSGEKEKELERQNERSSWHVGKLEAVMRMLENGKVTPDQVNDLKEDVSYFVESNQEEDFEEDEGIYDELNLDEEEETGFLPTHTHEDESDMLSVSEDNISLTPAKASTKASHAEDSSIEHYIPTSPSVSKKTPVRKLTAESTKHSIEKTEKTSEKPSVMLTDKSEKSTPVKINSVSTPSTNPSSVATVTVPAPTNVAVSSPASASAPAATSTTTTAATRQPSLPPIKYAAAAAAAVAASASASSPITGITSPPPVTAAPVISSPPATSSGSSILQSQGIASATTTPSFAPGSPVTTKQQHQQQVPVSQSAPSLQPTTQASPDASKAQYQHVDSSLNGHGAPPPGITPIASPSAQQPQSIQQQAIGHHMQSAGQSGQPMAQQSMTNGRSPPINDQGVGAVGSTSAESTGVQAHTPNALSDLMSQFEGAKQRSIQRLADVDGLHAALENGLASAPEPRDAERPRYYHPRNPCQTPPYYPQQPHPALDDKNLYARLDLDTLFFIFYYKTNTYEQWCAARELKRQSWRFHKQYLTWFQRLSQPQAITDEYEQGMYIYFDWENTWCQRKKSDFRFEYRWLSED